MLKLVIGITTDMYAIRYKLWTEAKSFGTLQERNYSDIRFYPPYNNESSGKIWSYKNTSKHKIEHF